MPIFFAFRFLSLPSAWMKDHEIGNRADVLRTAVPNWFSKWPTWWRTVGPKAPDDSYARLIWQMPDAGPQVTYEWAKTGANEVVCRITNSDASDMLLQGYVPWDSHPPDFSVLYSESKDRNFLRGRSWVPGTRDAMRWVLALSEPVRETAGTGTTKWNGYIPQVKTLYLCGKQGQTYELLEQQTRQRLDKDKIDQLLDENRRRYEAERPVGSGWLADVPAAINDQLQWSEVYTPKRKHAYITVSRAWARSNNSAPDFLWDSFLSALLVCQEDERKSFALVRDITNWQNEQGMFTSVRPVADTSRGRRFSLSHGATRNIQLDRWRSLRSTCGGRTANSWMKFIPRLLKAHRWWFSDRGDGQPWRDGNRNGLLELGSNYPDEIPYADRQQVAYFESHDDSPQWWHVAPYNEKTNIEFDTVERNCMYAMDAWVLSWMARELGRPQDAAELDREHAAMAERINRLLWNPAQRLLFQPAVGTRKWIWFMPQMAPDIFFSLLGRVAHARSVRSAPKSILRSQEVCRRVDYADDQPRRSIIRGSTIGEERYGARSTGWSIRDSNYTTGTMKRGLLAESSAKMFLKTVA